jgi:hypothetical protein
MSVFDPIYTFTVFDRYFVSNISWGYFELKQLQLDYYTNDYKKKSFKNIFNSLKENNILDTNISIKDQIGNFSTKNLKLSDYNLLEKKELFSSIKDFIDEYEFQSSAPSKDERTKRFENYFKSFIPDIEHKINQLIHFDINVFKLDLTNNEKNKLAEFPIYEYFQHYLIEFKNDNLCAIINLGYD